MNLWSCNYILCRLFHTLVIVLQKENFLKRQLAVCNEFPLVKVCVERGIIGITVLSYDAIIFYVYIISVYIISVDGVSM